MHVIILAQVGHLLCPTLWPGEADQKATVGKRRTGKRRQIRMLPCSSVAHKKLVDMVILADISHLLGLSFWPLIANKWFHDIPSFSRKEMSYRSINENFSFSVVFALVKRPQTEKDIELHDRSHGFRSTLP